MYGLPNGEIPSVGKVELAWIQTPLPPVNLSKPEAATASKMEDVEGDAMAEDSSPTHGNGGAGAANDQREDIDYDVADDNDWGVQ